jgi:hypothetical protein
MLVQLLIDDIVRQTTLLIAQLSTAAGLRAPLARIADQVFLDLARELEAQGVGQKVAADMFGLALRSYQLKLKRLSESADTAHVSLWQDIHDRLSSASATRRELQRAFTTSDPKDVAAVLHDMVKSGVAYSSGRGPDSVYGLTSAADRERLSESARRQVLGEMAWYLVARGVASTRAELVTELRAANGDLDAALEALLDGGQLRRDGERLVAQRFEVGVGAEQGWETAVCDHFRSVATAIAAKVNRPRSAAGDRVGGGTLSFLVHDAHPQAADVYALLESTRARAGMLWRQVAAHNEVHPPPEGSDRVTFYFGQMVIDGASEEQSK